jgi:hypothetical protein
MGATIVRVLLGVIGAGLLIGGLLLFFIGGPVIGLGGAFWLIVPGMILLIAVIIEASRYRSQAAELGHMAPGPGGGEPQLPEPRFRPTDEVFVDPTSKRRMRVYVDARTGERRYLAEG